MNEFTQHQWTQDYLAYIESPEWEAKRQEFIAHSKEIGRHFCATCSYPGTSLQVHHRTYFRLGREEMRDLTLLCARCHKYFHDVKRAELAKSEAKPMAEPLRKPKFSRKSIPREQKDPLARLSGSFNSFNSIRRREVYLNADLLLKDWLQWLYDSPKRKWYLETSKKYYPELKDMAQRLYNNREKQALTNKV